MPQVNFRVSDGDLTYEYKRACQLLGCSQSVPLQRALQATVKLARERYPDAFKALTPAMEQIVDAINELSTVYEDLTPRYPDLTQISTHLHLRKGRVLATIELMKRRRFLIEETDHLNGISPKSVYRINRKLVPLTVQDIDSK